MAAKHVIGPVTGGCVLLLAAVALAQNTPASPSPALPPVQTSQGGISSSDFTLASLPIYKPPPLGAPRDSERTNGGTRSGSAGRAELFVLAPEGIGYSMTVSPLLSWFVLKGEGAKVQVTVTQDDEPRPLLDVMLDAPGAAGIFALSLADRRVTLKRGVEYKWSVAVVTDPQRRERDIVASTRLICMDPPADLQARLATAGPARRVALLAEASYWYDALAVLATAIPNQPAARAHRAALLDQVGLKDAAAFDRGK